jgi:hypothetical protein
VRLEKKTGRVEGLVSAKAATSFPSDLFGYLDFVEPLLRLSQSQAFGAVKNILEGQLARQKELLLLSLASLPELYEERLPVMQRVLDRHLPDILANYLRNGKLIDSLWESCPKLVVNTVCEMHYRDGGFTMASVLEMTQHFKESLRSFLYCDNFKFAITLGVLAGRKEYLFFEKWLKDRLSDHPREFLLAMLTYIEGQVFTPLENDSSKAVVDSVLESANLTKELLSQMFEAALKVPPVNFSASIAEKLKNLYKRMCEIFPELSETPLTEEC